MSRFIDMLRATAARSPRGFVTGEPNEPHRQTWAEIHGQARHVAAKLIADGARPGAALAVLAAEPALTAPAVQGVWLAGGSVTMLHQPTRRTDLAVWSQDTVGVLDMIGSQLVLLDPTFEQLAPVLAERGIDYRLLADLVEPSGAESDGAVSSGCDPAALAAVPVPVGEDDAALLQLTSGSTGTPKAVRITHGNLVSNITSMAEAARYDPDNDVMVSWLPLFHDMGMIGFLAQPMALGIEVVMVTPLDFLSAPLVWPTLLSTYRATVTAGPNFAYGMVARSMNKVDDPDAFDLSRLRMALNAAEPIDEAILRNFTEAGARYGLPPESVLPAYGMAEATLTVSATLPDGAGFSADVVDAEQLKAVNRAVPPGAGAASRMFSRLGPPLPGLEVSVVDSDGVLLGDREVGQLRIRGASVTSGYLTVDGPVTAQDGHGWLDTGDLGYLVDGEVVVCGRSKDVIIMGGTNIYPTDIERAATSVEGVRAGHAVAVRLEAGTGRERFAVAAESTLAGNEEGEQLLRKGITVRVVDMVGVRPAAVHILKPGSLPKTSSGKLRRAAAGELLSAQ